MINNVVDTEQADGVRANLERDELLALRAEKRQNDLTELARTALVSCGISGNFAPYLVGKNETDTKTNVRAFESQFEAVLADEINTRVSRTRPASEEYTPNIRARGVRVL